MHGSCWSHDPGWSRSEERPSWKSWAPAQAKPPSMPLVWVTEQLSCLVPVLHTPLQVGYGLRPLSMPSLSLPWQSSGGPVEHCRAELPFHGGIFVCFPSLVHRSSSFTHRGKPCSAEMRTNHHLKHPVPYCSHGRQQPPREFLR